MKQCHSNVDEYIKELERQNDDLRASIERYALIVGSSYKIFVVDETMDRIDFCKIMEYYASHGWIHCPKRETSDEKRRWEYFNLTKESLNLIGEKRWEKNFAFPYKPKSKTLVQKYKQETTEAINKFNIMLNLQAVIENKEILEIYDYWVKNFSY